MTRDNAMLLTVDVGNSRIKLGLFDRRELSAGSPELPTCLQAVAVRVDERFPWPEIIRWIEPEAAGSAHRKAGCTCVLAGANPTGIQNVLDTWPAVLGPGPAVLSDSSTFPLTIDVDEPCKVGVDRLLNAIAANVVRPAGRPAIIVDSGTATTVDFVSSDGAFQGGAILPGFELSARSLHQYTALLPLISVEELASPPPDPRGRNTRDAIRSGLFWGQWGAVRELVARLNAASSERVPDAQSIRDTESACVLLTGGGAALLAPLLPEARWEPHLALQGLALVAATV